MFPTIPCNYSSHKLRSQVFESEIGSRHAERAKTNQRYFKHTLYLHRCLRAKQLLRASELMRAAYHEKEVQFNPIKDNQRPTATRDEYLLLFWWLNGSTEGFRLRLFSTQKTRNWSLAKDRIVLKDIISLSFPFLILITRLEKNMCLFNFVKITAIFIEKLMLVKNYCV